MALAARGHLRSLAAAGAGQLARLATRSGRRGLGTSARRVQCASDRCATGLTSSPAAPSAASKLQAAVSFWRAAASRLGWHPCTAQACGWHRSQLQRGFAAAAAGQEGGPSEEAASSPGRQAPLCCLACREKLAQPPSQPAAPANERRPKPLRTCGHCGSQQRDMRQCGRCRVAGFCGVDCQRAAWPVRAAAHRADPCMHASNAVQGMFWTLPAAPTRAIEPACRSC